MRGNAYAEADAVDTVVARLRANTEKVALFRRGLRGEHGNRRAAARRGDRRIRTPFIAMNSPFDRYQAGDDSALNAKQRRGMELFDEVGCDRCHEGAMFSDSSCMRKACPNTHCCGAGRGRAAIPVPHPDSAQCRPDGAVHAQRHTRDSQRRAALLRQRPIGESERVDSRDDGGRRTGWPGCREVPARRRHERE